MVKHLTPYVDCFLGFASKFRFVFYSVAKLFQRRFKQNLWGHQIPNREALIDCRASYDVSVFEAAILQQQKGFFNRICSKAEDHEVLLGNKAPVAYS